MNDPMLNKDQLEIIRLRNEGKNNSEIAVILVRSKSSLGKAINKINKIDPYAIKEGKAIHTEVSNIEKLKAKQIAISLEELNIQVIDSLLRESYPKLFNDEHIPLALGIRQLINEAGVLDEFTDLAKKTFFRRWVLHPDYSKSCLVYQHRFDLEGNKVGDILPRELIQAKSIVKHGIQHGLKKVNKNASADLIYSVLKKYFSHVFNKSKLVELPLDMDKQLLASPLLEGFTIKDINKVLDQWKNRIAYQQAIKHQNFFTNIDGSESYNINQNHKLTNFTKVKEISSTTGVLKTKPIEKKKEPIIITKKRRTLSLSK